jgi:hypothetical protein
MAKNGSVAGDPKTWEPSGRGSVEVLGSRNHPTHVWTPALSFESDEPSFYFQKKVRENKPPDLRIKDSNSQFACK